MKILGIMLILPSIVAITFIDAAAFGGTWKQYIVASVIEVLCFITGILYGLRYKKEVSLWLTE